MKSKQLNIDSENIRSGFMSCYFAIKRCTVIYGTPTMYVDILNQPTFSQYNTKSLEWGKIFNWPKKGFNIAE